MLKVSFDLRCVTISTNHGNVMASGGGEVSSETPLDVSNVAGRKSCGDSRPLHVGRRCLRVPWRQGTPPPSNSHPRHSPFSLVWKRKKKRPYIYNHAGDSIVCDSPPSEKRQEREREKEERHYSSGPPSRSSS